MPKVALPTFPAFKEVAGQLGIQPFLNPEDGHGPAGAARADGDGGWAATTRFPATT
jgi:hypothetical protein